MTIENDTITKCVVLPFALEMPSLGPSKDLEMPVLLTAVHNVENFGLRDIDWQVRRVTLSLRGRDGGELESVTIKFADLGIMLSSTQ